MGKTKLSAALSLFVLTVGLPGVSIAQSRARYGLADSHHVWRDASYWHGHYPAWVYRYHPEWVVDEPGWWQFDHPAHPEWFDYPFWHEYPIWRYGAYDQYHVWRYADWWHARDPEWMYMHHPEWAGAHAEWLRMDHGAHPDWFRSNYWREHPRDWDHPDSFYRHYALQAENRGGYHEAYNGRDRGYENRSYDRAAQERGVTTREEFGRSQNGRPNSILGPGGNGYAYRAANAYSPTGAFGRNFGSSSAAFHPGGAGTKNR
jgi:hypothetical protein